MGGVYLSSIALNISTVAMHANVTTMLCSVSSLVLLAENPNRKGVVVYNNAIYNLLLKFGGDDITPTSFTILIGPGSIYESPTISFGGVIWCVWEQFDENGIAHVTELF